MTQQSLLGVSTPKTQKRVRKDIYATLCSLQHYSQWPRLGDNEGSLDRGLAREGVVHVCHGVLLAV